MSHTHEGPCVYAKDTQKTNQPPAPIPQKIKTLCLGPMGVDTKELINFIIKPPTQATVFQPYRLMSHTHEGPCVYAKPNKGMRSKQT